MADFTSNVPSVQAQVDPIAPVQNNVAAQAVASIGGTLGGLGAAVINANNYSDQLKQATYKSKALGTLEQNILRNADLHDQGVLTQDQARRNIRRMTAESLANHPLLQDDINNLVGKTLSTVGLAADVAAGTQQEQDQHTNQQKFIQQAQAAGYGSPNDPPAVQQQMAHAYQGVQLAKAQLEQQQQVINFDKSKVELGNAQLSTIAARQGIANNATTAARNQIGLMQDQHKLQFTQNISKLTQAYDPVFNKNMDDIRDNTKLSAEEKIQAYQAQLNAVQSSATAVAIGADSGGAADSITKIYQNRAQIYMDEASGKLTKTVADNTISNMTTAAQIAMGKQDPAFLRATAISKMLPTGMSSMQEIISNKAGNILASHSELPDVNGEVSKTPATVITDGTSQSIKDVKQASGLLLENLKQFNSGSINDPQHLQELNTNANNFVKSFSIHGTTAQDATDLKTAVQTLASPQFGIYASNPKNTVSKDFLDKAADIYKTGYEAELVPMLQKQFLNDSVIIGQQPDTSAYGAAKGNTVPNAQPDTSQIHVQFIGGKATFIPNDPTNKGVVAKVTQLNSDLSPIIGTMVRADAHLHGSIDYDSYGKMLLEQVMPPVTPSGE